MGVWWELALNPRVVLAYYNSPPELRGVEVHSVRLLRDGPTLELVAELPCFPDRPSPRWPAGANMAQAGMQFFDLREVSLAGWGTSNTGDLRIEGSEGAIRFRFECPTSQLAGVAGFFDVTGISGYITSRNRT
jgi:Immunity protein 50